jgi:polar amino acid transport system substrate-binding protein
MESFTTITRENTLRILRTIVALALLPISLHGVAAQNAPYRILAGDLPPFTTEKGADAPGALGAMVKELEARIGVSAPIEFLPWPRAQAFAQKDTRVLILPLTRTPEREVHYRWMVKLYQQRFVFIARRASGVNVHSVDELRKLRIVVLRDSPNVPQLRSRNFMHIIEVNTVDDMTHMLKLDMVDAIYGGDEINLHVLDQNGVDRADLNVSNPLENGEVWLGGSLDLTQDEANTWQKAMLQLKADGSYKRILQAYHLPE